MRQTHVAGEKLFVDFAGDTVAVFDAATGMEGRAHPFVAVLGASNYTYAEARWSEGLADWIATYVNALGAIFVLGGASHRDIRISRFPTLLLKGLFTIQINNMMSLVSFSFSSWSRGTTNGQLGIFSRAHGKFYFQPK